MFKNVIAFSFGFCSLALLAPTLVTPALADQIVTATSTGQFVASYSVFGNLSSFQINDLQDEIGLALSISAGSAGTAQGSFLLTVTDFDIVTLTGGTGSGQMVISNWIGDWCDGVPLAEFNCGATFTTSAGTIFGFGTGAISFTYGVPFALAINLSVGLNDSDDAPVNMSSVFQPYIQVTDSNGLNETATATFAPVADTPEPVT